MLLNWSKKRVDPSSSQTERWEATHGSTTLSVFRSRLDGLWSYEINADGFDLEQVETGGVTGSFEEAKQAVCARASDRNLLR
jgi:hypothetical protein